MEILHFSQGHGNYKWQMNDEIKIDKIIETDLTALVYDKTSQLHNCN